MEHAGRRISRLKVADTSRGDELVKQRFFDKKGAEQLEEQVYDLLQKYINRRGRDRRESASDVGNVLIDILHSLVSQTDGGAAGCVKLHSRLLNQLQPLAEMEARFGKPN